ncbi:hypothetical protein [Burkholderia ubonensis]|uniref:hypothetical protein n=1 Tax=Burkholderia ubonensis TaxID=101571 RepID=UPI0011607A46|nr:hypothetical protein [Burkholderia ubonensis]
MKKTNAKILASLLRRIARELEGLSDADLQELDESVAPLLSRSGGGGKGRLEKSNAKLDFDVGELLGKLRALTSRDEGVSLLNQVAPTKDRLMMFAKALDLPVGKRNSNEEIIFKVVEATIGFRIRSAAIRGESSDNRQEGSMQSSKSTGEQGEKLDVRDTRDGGRNEKLPAKK